MPKKDYDKIHRTNMDVYARKIQAIYDSAVKEASSIGVTIHDFNPDKMFSFTDYPITATRVEKLVKSLQNNIETVILNGTKHEWTLSNNKNNELARRVFGDSIGELSKVQEQRYFSNNLDVRDAFRSRKVAGLGLSDRIWKYTNGFKQEIALSVDVGLRDRLSDAEMSRNMRDYLQNPDKLFRRVRDEHGVLKLSKAAKAYHPGKGVYRSSAKNAQRLARTEINMAYRTADHERWQQFDFVVGIEIRRSNNLSCHCPLCDSLVGKYPKDFKFTGWHPQCRCHAIPILKTIDELNQETDQIVQGVPTTAKSVNSVDALPNGYNDWVEQNKGRFGATNTPYFVRDNYKDGQISQGLKTNISPAFSKPTPLDVAKQRHDARTAKQEDEIQERWKSRHASVIMGGQSIDSIDKVQGVIDRFLSLYPDETNGKRITMGTYKKRSSNGGFSIMRANSPSRTIELNNVCYPQMKDSPYTRLKTALDKIRQNKSLSFDEEYSVESLYHEILHCKAKEWRRLLPHGKGDYKRTAMETVNQFVSRHEYPKFIERLGGKAINHAEVLERGIGYSDWVGNFRGYLNVAKIDERKALEYFKDRLLSHSYDSLDDTLARYIKDNANGVLSAYSNNDILESLQAGGDKWDFVLNLIRLR